MVLKVAGGGGGTAGAVNYLGTWNASTNTPTLVSGVGTKGGYYIVSVAGTTTLDGISLWSVGDWAVFNGTVWQKVNGSSNEAFNGITVTSLTGYMYANNTSPVTASTTIPVASVTGAVPNTTYVLAGTNLTGGGALTGNVTLNIANTAVTAGTYGNAVNIPQIVVNSQGQITSASNVAITYGTGSVTNVATGTGLSGGPITTTGTISIANTTVTSGTYGNASAVGQFVVNAQGQLTSAANVAISIPSGQVTGLGTMATQNANAVAITGGTINSVSHTGGTYANANITSVAATFPNSYLANSSLTLGNTSVSLGSTASSVGNLTLQNVTIGSVSTPITAAEGGTGVNTLTANAVIIGNGTGAVTSVAPGTSGYVLTSNGTAWVSQVLPASGVTIQTDSANATRYMVFSNVTTGTVTIENVSTNITVNPSTGFMSAPTYVSTNGLTFNSSNVTSNITVSTGYNAVSVGPMTLANGVTVTVATGQRWVVL